jgi:hypothetical protein
MPGLVGFMFFSAVVAALAAFDVLADRFGVDSRDAWRR